MSHMKIRYPSVLPQIGVSDAQFSFWKDKLEVYLKYFVSFFHCSQEWPTATHLWFSGSCLTAAAAAATGDERVAKAGDRLLNQWVSHHDTKVYQDCQLPQSLS